MNVAGLRFLYGVTLDRAKVADEIRWAIVDRLTVKGILKHKTAPVQEEDEAWGNMASRKKKSGAGGVAARLPQHIADDHRHRLVKLDRDSFIQLNPTKRLRQHRVGLDHNAILLRNRHDALRH